MRRPAWRNATAAERVELAPLPQAISPGTIGRMPSRVLIVDDNRAFRAAARELLERGGFVVVGEAGSGEEAVREAESRRPEVPLVDLQLPDCDGFQVAERLCRLDPALQVILTSSLDASDFGALVAARPARGFVPKDELSVRAIGALLGPSG